MSDFKRERTERFVRVIDRVSVAVVVLAVATLMLDWGWIPEISQRAGRYIMTFNVVVTVFFVFETLSRFFLTRFKVIYLRTSAFDLIQTTAFLVLMVFARAIHESALMGPFLCDSGISLAAEYVFLMEAYVFLTLVSKAVAYQKRISAAKFEPAMVVLGSFALVIAFGAILLYSPHAASDAALGENGPGQISFIDALFTSTSAVCVTGLNVKDTGVYFSGFGQAVILALIQVGGLGLMTFVTFSSLIIGKGMALSERVVMQDVLSFDIAASMPRLILDILLLTIGFEAVGALILYPMWQGDITSGERLWLSVFHSVSAFCNAGFSLFSNNLVDYRGSVVVNAVITGLIIFGGLGFLVERDLSGKLWSLLKRRGKTRHRMLKDMRATRMPARLGLQTKIVIVASVALLAAGTALFALFEWNGALSGMSLKERLLVSWFQSVTPRTAGFNTVDTTSFWMPTYLMLTVLMFIGASPGGTGGGIKTSTFAIIVATVRSTINNRLNVEIFKRTINPRTIRQSLTVVFISVALVTVGVAVLAMTTPGVPMELLLFEEVSAFGTVGMSAGTPGTPLSLSASLSWAGKLVIILTMFIGRIGPLTLAIAIAQKSYTVNYEYPSERVIIG